DVGFFATVAVGQVLPTVRQRFEVRADVLAALRGETTPGRFDVPGNWPNWNLNAGAQIMPKNPGYRDEVNPATLAYYPATWRPDPIHEVYVRRFLGLAARRGIPVYWLLPPIGPAVQARREALGLDGLEIRFIRSLQEKYPNVTVINGR